MGSYLKYFFFLLTFRHIIVNCNCSIFAPNKTNWVQKCPIFSTVLYKVRLLDLFATYTRTKTCRLGSTVCQTYRIAAYTVMYTVIHAILEHQASLVSLLLLLFYFIILKNLLLRWFYPHDLLPMNWRSEHGASVCAAAAPASTDLSNRARPVT